MQVRQIGMLSARSASPVGVRAPQQAMSKAAVVSIRALKAAAPAVPAAPAESTWYRIKKGFLSFLGRTHFYTDAAHKMTMKQAEELAPKLKPGDIILRRVDGVACNVLNPGWWKHAGIYVGDGKVVHAVAEGVCTVSVYDFIHEGQHAIVWRPKGATAAQDQKMVEFAKQQVGKPYDYNFDFKDTTRFACTELAADAVNSGMGKEVLKTNWLGGIVADMFNGKNFDLVWTNTPEKALAN